ncbi:MAG TPA: DUF559 domain-containing protein, partial [Acidimicrobiia bacterium]
IVGAVPTWEQAVLAAVLAAGPGAVASHETAAALWGLPGAERSGLEVTTDRPHCARLVGVRSHRTLAFLAVEHSSRAGIPLTSVARTLVDLSARWSVKQLGRAADHAQRRGLLRLEQLRICVGGLTPAPGRRPGRIHALLARRLHGYDPGDSDLEVRFARALVAGGLPEPVLQHWVRIGHRRYRIDLAYPDAMVAIEIDGWDTHRSRSAFDADRARANDLVVAGWRVLRFTSSTTDGEAVTVVAEALGALTQRGSA